MLWIAALAVLAYLPAALQLTYYRDDWYYAYDAMVGPAGVFRYMFAQDRPARGPFFEIYYALFGIAPTPYHLAMLFWRVVGGAAVAWLFHLLWPRRATAGLVGGALFALYPGFTWWVQGIEYQPMVASAALTVISLCLTVLALRVKGLWPRVLCIAGAILTGWIYLALVEYAAGMELFRIALVYSALDAPKLQTLRLRAATALRKWLPYLIIPAGFMLWRFVFFTSGRKATDLGTQLSGFLADPLSTGLHWLMNFLLSFINVTLAAWVQPLQSSFFSLRLRDQVSGLALALAAGALAWFLLRRDEAPPTRKRGASDEHWQSRSVWLGLAGLVVGILPIILANRQITLPSFSHYALPASLGLAFVVVGLVSLLSARRTQVAVFAVLIALSVLTLQGLGVSALQEERTIASFWRQMVWRAPSIAPGTTLLVYYPGIDYGTDSDVVWGPANFIYYPQQQAALPVRVQVSALTAGKDSLISILERLGAQESTYRAHTMSIDYSNVLIAVQSTPDSCVRVLGHPLNIQSRTDDPLLQDLAIYSHIDRISGSIPSAAPRPDLFGSQPEHGWCYYFENAMLAALDQDWPQVAALYDTAGNLGLHPNDQVEWMPFLLAKAQLGDQKAVKDIATRINTDRLYTDQACLNLLFTSPLSPEMHRYVIDLFRCSVE